MVSGIQYALQSLYMPYNMPYKICPTKFQIQSDRIATIIEFNISNLEHYTVPDSLTCVKFK